MTEQSFLGMDESKEAETKQKSGFFSKLFGKKEADSDSAPNSPVKVNVVSSESEIHYDDWSTSEENHEDSTLNEADIDNIREALGLKTSKSKSKQQKFETPIEKKSKMIKNTKKVTSKNSKEKDDLPLFSEKQTNKSSSDSLADTSVSTISNMQKEWSEFSNKKVASMSDSKQTSNMDRTKKSKLVKEFESSLKKEAKKYESKIKKEASNTISKLKKDISILAKRDKHLRLRESKLLNHLRKLDEKEAELEEDITRLEAMKSEISYLADDKKNLEKSITESKAHLESIKTELSLTNKELEHVKARIKKENDDASLKLKHMHKEYQDEELRHKKELKSLSDKISSAKVTLSDMQKKGAQILKQLKTKEDDLKKREQKIAYLLEDNKNILVKLEESTRDARPFSPAKEVITSTKSQRYPSSDPVISLRDKMSECKHLADVNNLEDAKSLYNEIREEFSKLSEVSEAEKEKLKHDIKEIYDEISLKIMNPPKRSY